MTNLQKVVKLLTYIKRHEPYSFEGYVVKNGVLYLASWEVDGHNGDIEEYREVEAKESDIYNAVIADLEGKMIQIKDSIDERVRRQKVRDEFYQS